MTLLRIDATGKTCLPPARFDHQQELEAVLAEHPDLLVTDRVPAPVVVCRHLSLANVAALPLVTIDHEAVPIVVETESAAADSRGRTLVARAVDHLWALALSTTEQVDEAAGAGMTRALREIAGDDRCAFDRLWASVGANLAAARIRLILAVDEPWPELGPMVAFLAERTRFDVRCIAVGRSRGSDGDTYYASTLLHASKTAPKAPHSARRTALRLVGSATDNRVVDRAWRPAASPTIAAFDLGRVRWDG